MHRDSVQAANWWAQPRGAQAASWVQGYQRSIAAPHRTQLASIVLGFQPETALEVGCHCGPNLVRLTRASETLQAIGIDASEDAIQAGRRWIDAEGVSSRVQLNVGRFPSATAGVANGAFDVVMTCYALAYVAPADMDAALYEIGRLATKAVVLAEPMPGDGQRPDRCELSGYCEYAHDYAGAAPWISSLSRLSDRSVVPVMPRVDRLNGILVASCPLS